MNPNSKAYLVGSHIDSLPPAAVVIRDGRLSAQEFPSSEQHSLWVEVWAVPEVTGQTYESSKPTAKELLETLTRARSCR